MHKVSRQEKGAERNCFVPLYRGPEAGVSGSKQLHHTSVQTADCSHLVSAETHATFPSFKTRGRKQVFSLTYNKDQRALFQS